MFGHPEAEGLIGDSLLILAVPRQQVAFGLQKPCGFPLRAKLREREGQRVAPVTHEDALRAACGLMHQRHHIGPGGQRPAYFGNLGGRVRVRRAHAFGIFGQAERFGMEQSRERCIQRRGVLRGRRQGCLFGSRCQRNAERPRRRLFPRQIGRSRCHKLLHSRLLPLIVHEYPETTQTEQEHAQCTGG